MTIWIIIAIVAFLIVTGVYNHKKAEREKRFDREMKEIENREVEPSDEPSTFHEAQDEPKKEKIERRIQHTEEFRRRRAQQLESLPESIDVKVKGTSYRSFDEIAAARMCDVGESMILKPEPDNEVDPNAIKVFTMEGYHIGYVEAPYASVVKSNIKQIKRCVISKRTNQEIPYINLHIDFSENELEIEQPGFIKKEYQCSPEDMMRNLASGNLGPYQYRSELLCVQDLYERSRKTIAKARACRKGDKIVLKKGDTNELYPDRIDIYLSDNTYLGYADDFSRAQVYALFDNVVDAFVDHPISADRPERFGVRVIFPAELKYTECYPKSDGSYHYYKGNYQEVKLASTIRQTDPVAALEILLPIVERERGIEASKVCIACYYQLKMWQERIDLIQKMINRIDNLTEEDLPKHELMIARLEIPKLNKQLDFSIKRLESQQKKSKK